MQGSSRLGYPAGAGPLAMMMAQQQRHHHNHQQHLNSAQAPWASSASDDALDTDDLNRYSFHQPPPAAASQERIAICANQPQQHQQPRAYQENLSIPQLELAGGGGGATLSDDLSRRPYALGDSSPADATRQQNAANPFSGPATTNAPLKIEGFQARPVALDCAPTIAPQENKRHQQNKAHHKVHGHHGHNQHYHTAEDYLRLQPTNQNLIFKQNHRGQAHEMQANYSPAARLKQLTNYAVQQRQQAVASGLAAAAAEAALARHQQQQQQQQQQAQVSPPLELNQQQQQQQLVPMSIDYPDDQEVGPGARSPGQLVAREHHLQQVGSDRPLFVDGSFVAANQLRPRVNSVSTTLGEARRLQTTPTSYSPVPFLTRSMSFSSGTTDCDDSARLGQHELSRASYNLQTIQGHHIQTNKLVVCANQQQQQQSSFDGPNGQLHGHNLALQLQYQQQQHQQQPQQLQLHQQQYHHQFSSSISSPGSSTDSATPISCYNQSPTPMCGFGNLSPQLMSGEVELASPSSLGSQSAALASRAGSSLAGSDAFGLGINLEQYISKRNERERSRVRNVNDAFDHLKNSLPLEVERMTKRMSKVEILRTAISYIRDLESVLDSKQQQQQQQQQH